MLISNIIIRTKYFCQLCNFLKTKRSTKINLGFAFCSTLSSYNNNTISTTSTINCCRRRIL